MNLKMEFMKYIVKIDCIKFNKLMSHVLTEI